MQIFPLKKYQKITWIVVVLLATAACQKGHPLPSSTTSQRIFWQSCKNPEFDGWFKNKGTVLPDLECGYLEAPLAYDGPDRHALAGKNVRLAVTRLPASGSKKGSLIYISGGPGIAGINPPLKLDGAMTPLRQSFDIIGYDPRGVGQSSPYISCRHSSPNIAAPAAQDSDTSGTNTSAAEQLIAEAERYAREFVTACVKNTGADVLRHVGTHEAVNDLEMLRMALGESTLTGIAYSYGTQVAAMYAERYPAKVRALTLDGVVDLSEDNTTMRTNQYRSYQNTFDRFAAFCNRTGSCSFAHGTPMVEEKYQALLQKIDGVSVLNSDRRRTTSTDVYKATILSLLWSNQWPRLARALNQLDKGNSDAIMQIADDFDAATESEAAAVSISCADSASPAADPRTSQNTKRQLYVASTFDKYGEIPERFPLDYCDFWPASGTLKAHKPMVSAMLPPLLFVAQRHDPTTPYINARTMASFFRSPLITREGDGHTLALNGIDQCVDAAVVSYLLNPDRPRQDTICR